MTPGKPYLQSGSYAFMYFDSTDKCTGWEATNLNRIDAEAHATAQVPQNSGTSIKVIYVVFDTKLGTWSPK